MAKNKKAYAPKELRTLDAIREEHRNEMGKLAQAKYLVFVYQAQAKEACERLLEINQEAALRQQSEEAAAKATAAATTPEVTNVQS